MPPAEYTALNVDLRELRPHPGVQPKVMYDRYSLILMLTHACNLRCSYCYMGQKTGRTMPESLGRKAIDRAVASLNAGGTLELGFFGGEPLLVPELLQGFIDYAEAQTAARGLSLRMGLTTNGTQTSPAAWRILCRPDMDVAVSCDGLPEVHDRHRRDSAGRGSSQQVLATITRLLEAGKALRIVLVVRPDTLDLLEPSARFLQSLGVRYLEPSLDLWTTWTPEDEAHLESAIARLADLWREGLPDHHIGWFDEEAAHLAKLPIPKPTRCVCPVPRPTASTSCISAATGSGIMHPAALAPGTECAIPSAAVPTTPAPATRASPTTSCASGTRPAWREPPES